MSTAKRSIIGGRLPRSARASTLTFDWLRPPFAAREVIARLLAWADAVQRRHGVLGFPYAVMKKYGDDDGGRRPR